MRFAIKSGMMTSKTTSPLMVTMANMEFFFCSRMLSISFLTICTAPFFLLLLFGKGSIYIYFCAP